MRSIKSNYIVRWVLPGGESDDFDRLKGVSPETIKRRALACWRNCKLMKRYARFEIWQADKICYQVVANEPCEVVDLKELDILYK